MTQSDSVTHVQCQGREKRAHVWERASALDKSSFMANVMGINLSFKLKLLKKLIYKIKVMIKIRILKIIISKFYSYHCCRCCF